MSRRTKSLCRMECLARVVAGSGCLLSPPSVCTGEGEGWGAEGRLPAPGQLCYESLQIARYQAGQHFRAHEVLGSCWWLVLCVCELGTLMHDRNVLMTFAPTRLLSSQGGFSMSW